MPRSFICNDPVGEGVVLVRAIGCVLCASVRKLSQPTQSIMWAGGYLLTVPTILRFCG